LHGAGVKEYDLRAEEKGMGIPVTEIVNKTSIMEKNHKY
jgi:hypothetical protein